MSDRRRLRQKQRLKVDVGEEFEESKTTQNSRKIVTYVVLALGCLFILGATAKGFLDGDFQALHYVWSVVGPVYGAMSGYYFKASQDLE
jgi:hypothetical protein